MQLDANRRGSVHNGVRGIAPRLRQREVSHVFFPGAHHGFHVPHGLTPIALGVAAVATTLLGWAIFAAIPVSNDSHYSATLGAPAESVRSVAYALPEDGADVLYVRPVDSAAPPREVARFQLASFAGLHARGAAAPTAESIAVLSDSSDGFAVLSFVSLPSGHVRAVAAEFDHFSPLAWANDGSTVAAIRSTTSPEGANVTVVLEADAVTGNVAPVARFERAFEVAPLGYSLDGDRLFIVVVDQSGSSLWVEQDGRLQRAALLSPGRTRDWTLSHDGSRLAFIDILGAGERTYAGRVLVIATGAVTNLVSNQNQIGSAWMPGSQVPFFGGPGGQVSLTEPSAMDAYVVPVRWSPDGATLVATIITAGSDRADRPTQSIELVTENTRVPLAHARGAEFLGWVKDLE